MTIKNTAPQNKQINRVVYGLLAIVIVIFASIFFLLQFQNRENLQKEEIDHNYHLTISKYSVEIISTINKTKLWFRDLEILRFQKDTFSEYDPATSIIQIKLREKDQINELKVGIEKPVKEIIRLQKEYSDPEFKNITLLLEESHRKVSINLSKLLAGGKYSSQRIDAIVLPFLSTTIQLQRLHQFAYQEVRALHKDSQDNKHIQIIGLIIALAFTGIIGVFIMLRNLQGTLTKLTDTKEALQNERDFSHNLITTAPVIILLLDTKGCIQHVNPFFEQLTDYRLSDIKGKNWITKFIPEQDHNHITDVLQKTLHKISVVAKVNPILTRDGKELEIEWYTETMHDTTGGITGALSIGMDITERKKSEEKIRKYRDHLEDLVKDRTAGMQIARDEAERSNAAKTLFLSHMSHELRTPMNAILGFAQILKLDEGGFNNTQKENVSEIIDAGHHLLDLINELLDLTRIESGKMEVSMETVIMEDILQQSITLIEPQAKNRHLKIVDNISGMGYSLFADYTRLKQVLVNLLSNAVKYNKENGKITLDAKVINNDRLRLSIIDTGKGLDQAEIGQLFTSFARLDEANNVEGTGIGLVITKHLVELMGGSIGVNSIPEEGTEFWIEFELLTNI